MASSHAAHRALIADFAAGIRDGRAPRVTGVEVLRVRRLIDAILAGERQTHPIAPF